ncbi:MAG: aminodeoxychorismate lyase [Gammaproteobacteria bacterium]|jgi:4-amino-4-deoxychorismate lyase|nr:aminodeoxychorismate lyase [Gammaproteobacteria bacterium]
MRTDPTAGELLGALIDGGQGTGCDVRDRGLHYGDGLFETLAVREGAMPLWDSHMRRLAAGCAALQLPLPDTARLRAEAGRLCEGIERGVLKLILTRGPGPRGYRINHGAVRPTRLLLLYRPPVWSEAWWRDGVAVRLCTMRLGSNPALAGIKHLNRLEQVLARDEWTDPGIFEGLMMNREGRIVDGTMSNVFLCRGTELRTPAVSECGVAGVMREKVRKLARESGLRMEEGCVAPEDLASADEVFLSNALFGVLPVSRVGSGPIRAPGPIALRFARALAPFTLAPALGSGNDGEELP